MIPAIEAYLEIMIKQTVVIGYEKLEVSLR